MADTTLRVTDKLGIVEAEIEFLPVTGRHDAATIVAMNNSGTPPAEIARTLGTCLPTIQRYLRGMGYVPSRSMARRRGSRGLPWRQIKAIDYRDARRFAENGVSEAEIARRLGHRPGTVRLMLSAIYRCIAPSIKAARQGGAQVKPRYVVRADHSIVLKDNQLHVH